MQKLWTAAFLTSTLLVSPLSWAHESFMQGAHLGIQAGAQTNSFHGIEVLSTPIVGVHADYYWGFPEGVFAGLGAEYDAALDRSSSSANFQFFNLGTLGYKVRRSWTTAFTGYLGAERGAIALNMNLAVIVTHATADILLLNNTVEHDAIAGGIAPGVALNFKLTPDVTMGAHYRYEIFPYSVHGHNVILKVSYRL